MSGGTPFARFAATCEALRELGGRHAKRDLAADLLREVEPDERGPAARFLAGQPLSPLDDRDLGVGPSTVEEATRTDQAALLPGAVAIGEVAGALDELADLEGPGSADRRRALLGGLTGRLGEHAGWLNRLLLGELRTGVREGLALEAVAEAAGVDPGRVRRAHQLLGDVGEVAEVALGEGPEGLDRVDLELGRPLAPMLAEKAADLEEAVLELGPPILVEPKLDGARVQLHRDGDRVQVFSRRLTEVTDSLPEAVEVARRLDAEAALAVGEAYAVDADGQPRPFADLMRRFRRENERAVGRAEVPVEVRLFDLVHVDGATLLDEPLARRRDRLAAIAPEALLTPALETSAVEQAREAYERALREGHEGLVAKAPDSRCEPGRRGDSWLNVKPHRTLDLVVLGAERGHGRRSDWLSNYHLGVRVPPDQRDRLVEPDEPPSGPVTRREGYAMVGKTFKGLTDEEFAWATSRLEAVAERIREWGVEARPDLVVEVAFEEVQDSPHYESGYALRFARVTAIREDKPPDEVATLADVARLQGAARDPA